MPDRWPLRERCSEREPPRPFQAAVELSICLLPKHASFVGCTPNPFLSSSAPYAFISLSALISIVAIALLAHSLR